MERKNLLKAARGEIPMDLVIEGGKVVNTVTGTIIPSTLGIKDGYIALLLPQEAMIECEQRVNAEDFYIVPGFIDAYSNFSKTMLHPSYFSDMVLPQGVTTAVADMTSFAEVFGNSGTELLLKMREQLPIHLYHSAPVQIPVLPGLETVGSDYSENNLPSLLNVPEVLGVGPLLRGEELLEENARMDQLQHLNTGTYSVASTLPFFTEKQKQEVLLWGLNVELYAANTNLADALSRGQYVAMSRQDLTADRMQEILNLPDRSHLIFYSGKEWSSYYVRHGHMKEVVKKAIQLGMPPVEAIRCATNRPAQALGLNRKHGFLGAGTFADMLFIRDLEKLDIETVLCGGKVSFAQGKNTSLDNFIEFPKELNQSIHVKRCWPHHFELPYTEQSTAKAQILVAKPDTLTMGITEKELPLDENGHILSIKETTKAVVFERHGKRENLRQLALIQGVGAIDGAIATTYAPHSHPLLVFGNDEADMAMAANMLISSGGGMVAVQKGQLIQSVDLPVGGICSESPSTELSDRLTAFSDLLNRVMGLHHHSPLDWLTSICDTTLPGYHLTDYGIVNSDHEESIPLWVDTEVFQIEGTYQ